MSDPVSQELFARAQRVLPGGVNSPVRAFRAVGGEPVFITRARGSRIYGADGAEYVDYVGSWGPAILGHAEPEVVEVVRRTALDGLSFGAPTELEVRFAEAVRERVPSLELQRCTSSGTEATMSALRVARGATGRDLVVKMEGCYHGHADALLVKAGSGLATFGTPDSAGVPPGAAESTLVLPYNDLAALEAAFDRVGERIAAVILEPVAGNMGCVPPEPGYLPGVVELCARHGAISIFDEVMTGLRVAPGGAQERYGVTPRLTCLGKIVGGGMPLAIYGGASEVMRHISPLGRVYQAGTLSGNPLAVAAGLATLERLVPAVYERLEATSAALGDGLASLLRERGVAGVVQRVGSMLTLFFTERPVRSWSDAAGCDTERFARFHRGLLARGVYWPPSQFEAAFVSAAHEPADLDRTLSAARDALVS
ncbi:MAG: glutamate-1-semialdehyde 2,1-aminomutase [Polyangiaceae bacterium]|nr:glutamate-1-semialdehyde 2,1-aminomutase [Polyangiaceae bacterium]